VVATDTTGNDLVDAALDRLARTDRQEAEAARAAFASLTWGDGPDSVTLYGLCDWLWYRLPAKWMCGLGEHLQLAGALGALFGLLEMPRYARVCTSETTANVLAAWNRDRKEGIKAMAAARAASGVAPPDVPGLLTWGEVMGTEENSALVATATRLELTIAAGEFRPGARGWRKAAERAAATFLVTPRDDLDGDCWLQRIHSERLHEWARSRGSPRGPLTAAVASQLARPAPVPRQAADLLAPVRWLLGKAAEDGAIPLTQRHTLARAVVAEGCQRFGWLTLTGRPRSESDIVEAWTLRAMIRELGAVRRQGRHLYLTPAGKMLATASTAALWSAVAPAVLPASKAEAAAGEIALMLMLARSHGAGDDLPGTVADAMAAEGWHSPDSGQPIDSGAAGWLVGELLRRLRLLGLLEQRRGLTAARLTGPGRAAAHTALRAHALRPRDRSGIG
jgi:hypothetical protein